MADPIRKLAAIMFTDIAGFTALSSQDEEAALALLDQQREILKPIVAKHQGQWLKEIGDGLLLSFSSSKEAVNCAIEIQHILKEVKNLDLRIGIHQGDILEKGGDIFGDDVNIASRMEPFAAVGGVAISHKVAGDISSSPEFKLKLIGAPKLKGVKQQVRIYCITSHDLPETDVSKVSAKLEIGKVPKDSMGKSFWTHFTIKNVSLYAVLIWFFTNSLQFISTDLKSGILLGYTIKPNSQRIRMGIIDFEPRSENVDLLLLRAVKSELYKYLQRYKKLTLLGDFELEQIDITNLPRREISKKIESDFLVTGNILKTNHQYLVNSELYQFKEDNIVTHFSQSFPNLSLQKTSRLIADSLSNSYAKMLGLFKPKPLKRISNESESTFFGKFLTPFVLQGQQSQESSEISHGDEIYSVLVNGRKLLDKKELEANLDAIVLYETAIMDDELNGDLISALAESYYQRSQLDPNTIELLTKSEEYLTQAINTEKISTVALASAHYFMSKIHIDRGELTEARESIRRARKLNRSERIIHDQFKELTRLYLKSLGG